MSENEQANIPPSQLIGARIEHLNDWRGEVLSQLRALIHRADPDVVRGVYSVVPSVLLPIGAFLFRAFRLRYPG